MDINKMGLPTGLKVNNTNNNKTIDTTIDTNKNITNQSGSGKYKINHNNFITENFNNVLLKLEKDNILNLDNMLEVMN